MNPEFKWPFAKRFPVTSKFNEERIRNGKKVFHTGIDIAAPEGTKGRPLAAGFVIIVAYDDLNGKFLIIDHGIDEKGNRWTSSYCHCSKILVKEGDAVLTTRDMFEVGHTGHCIKSQHGTGDHLHLTLRKNGIAVNPLLYFKLPK